MPSYGQVGDGAVGDGVGDGGVGDGVGDGAVGVYPIVLFCSGQ